MISFLGVVEFGRFCLRFSSVPNGTWDMIMTSLHVLFHFCLLLVLSFLLFVSIEY